MKGLREFSSNKSFILKKIENKIQYSFIKNQKHLVDNQFRNWGTGSPGIGVDSKRKEANGCGAVCRDSNALLLSLRMIVWIFLVYKMSKVYVYFLCMHYILIQNLLRSHINIELSLNSYGNYRYNLNVVSLEELKIRWITWVIKMGVSEQGK